MEQYLVEQYLTRIGYASSPEQHILEPNPDPNSKYPSSPLPQTHSADNEELAEHRAELEYRRKVSQRIDRQIRACQKELYTYLSKQERINKEHEQRVLHFLKPEHDNKRTLFDAERQNGPMTAEEAEIEEMRDIYLQYDCESVGFPDADLVNAFFAIIADTERHLMKAEEANKAAKRRQVKLEGKLHKAGCAIYEVEDQIRWVENGGARMDAREPKMVGDRGEGHREEGRKSKRRRGAKGRRQAKGGAGGEGVGSRRKRRMWQSG